MAADRDTVCSDAQFLIASPGNMSQGKFLSVLGHKIDCNTNACRVPVDRWPFHLPRHMIDGKCIHLNSTDDLESQ